MRSTLSPRLAIDPVAYDTAWIAGLRSPDDPHQPRFPRSLGWLLRNQKTDGSWGERSPGYEFGTLVCTLAGLATVARFPAAPGTVAAREAAEAYLRENPVPPSHPSGEPVGFELLIPALVARARAAGASVKPDLDQYARIRSEKLVLIRPGALYSPNLPTIHSIEALGAAADLDRLRRLLGDVGGVGHSPAATAYWMERTADERPATYLHEALGSEDGAAAPVLHPCEQFESLWVLWHRFAAHGLGPDSVTADDLAAIAQWLTPEGVALAKSFPIADADNTAVALMLLDAAGLEIDVSTLERFRGDGLYVSYPIERTASVGVNAHVLQAVARIADYPDRDDRIAMLLAFLADRRVDDSHWYDKWHVSPYYATAHALVALRDVRGSHQALAKELAQTAIRWIQETAEPGRGWGANSIVTQEETAYVVLGAMAWPELVQDLPRLSSTARARLATNGSTHHPSLWIDKCLYRPPRIVDAAIGGARAVLDGVGGPFGVKPAPAVAGLAP